MGSHFSEQQKRCWSCEFFMGQRERKSGIIFGNSIETSDKGVCTCKRSTNYNKRVSDEDRGCSKYQRWGVLESMILKKQNEQIQRQQKIQNNQMQRQQKIQNDREKSEWREKQKLIDKQNQAEEDRIKREMYALVRERRALEEERKKLEYERWYNSLSPEEKEKENQRIKEEKIRQAKEAEEKRIRAEREAEERRIRAEREAEERRIRAEREAEERRIYEEAVRKERERQLEIEEAARKERERKLAIEEALAKKKKKRRIIIICCIVVLAIALLVIRKIQKGNEINSNLIYEYSYSLGGYTVSAGSLYECSSIFTIPSTYKGENVVEIKENGFAYQTGITELIIPDSIEKIGICAFKGCPNITTISIGQNIMQNKNFNTIFGENDESIKNIKNLIFTGTYVSGEQFKNCKFETVKLPNVKYIGKYAFLENPIKKLELSSSLKTIDEFAFLGCAFTALTIPVNVEYIGQGAFANKYLTTITVDSNNNYFCAIDNVLYSKDKTILYCYPGGLSRSVFLLPSSAKEIKAFSFSGNCDLNSVVGNSRLTTIGSGAFCGCFNITSLYLETGINNLGNDLFYGCSSVVTVYYAGTEKQWNEICFEENSNTTLNFATLVCTSN